VAATLRARAAVADEARALASQARASAAVLVGLPVVVAVGGAAADRKVADALLGTPWGLGCIALAGLLDLGGALWMQRVVSGARP
jgi:tight adherence protein B